MIISEFLAHSFGRDKISRLLYKTYSRKLWLIPGILFVCSIFTAWFPDIFAKVISCHYSTEKECLDYSTLTSANRSSSYSLPAVGSSASCDSDLTPQWYRFLFPAGVQMASSHVPPQKCATVLSGWLESKQPKMTDGIVNGKVCFSLGLNKCYRSQTIQVRNCGRFYVYKLQPTRSCPMRYCGQ